MTRRIAGVAVSALTCLGVLGIGLASAGTNPKADPSIKEVMKKLNGKGAELEKLNKAVKAEKPNWDAIQASAKTFEELANKLDDNDPPRGDETSWTKLTEQYGINATALAAAANDKDLPNVKDALGKLQKSCMPCHAAHKKK